MSEQFVFNALADIDPLRIPVFPTIDAAASALAGLARLGSPSSTPEPVAYEGQVAPLRRYRPRDRLADGSARRPRLRERPKPGAGGAGGRTDPGPRRRCRAAGAEHRQPGRHARRHPPRPRGGGQRFDILVNNAAWVRCQAVPEIAPETLEHMLDVGLKAVITAQALSVDGASP